MKFYIQLSFIDRRMFANKNFFNLKCVQLYVDVLARGCLDPKQIIDKQCSIFSSDVIVLYAEFCGPDIGRTDNEPAK